MSGTLKRRVTITNPRGFHLRPQQAFALLAKQFESTVMVSRDQQRLNGKNPWDLMLLSTATEVTLEVSGPDEQAAMEALAELLASPSVDDAPELPVPPAAPAG